MKKIFVFMIFCLIAGLPLPARSEEAPPAPAPLQLNAQFYGGLLRTPAILRDEYFKKKLNSVVLGRGMITSIMKAQRFKKNFRIDMIDHEAGRLNIRITYRLHVDSTHTISMLKEKEQLEFTGQLIGYTPMNSRRDAYILDILLEKGAMLIE